MLIRAAETKDFERLIRLLDTLFTVETDFTPDRQRQLAGIALLYASSTARILVAEIAASVVGMVTGQVVVSTAEGGVSLLVEDLIVDVSRRRCGVGSALLHAIGAWGAEHGAKRMQLLADRRNAQALSFYTQAGWRRTELICLRRYQSQPGTD